MKSLRIISIILCIILIDAAPLRAVPAGIGKISFSINVPDCLIHINGKIIEGGQDSVSLYLREGTYDYEVTSNSYYHKYKGTLLAISGEETLVEVNLLPAYGSLSVNCDDNEDLEDASVYVDGVLSGIAPCTVPKLISGSHTVLVSKRCYLPAEEKITVEDDKDVSISPGMTPNYTVVSITTSPEADILANGEKMGQGSWTGKIEPGTYIMESYIPYYLSGTMEVELAVKKDTTEISLPAPKPQYGSLKIECSPSFFTSKVYLDDKPVGIIPLLLEKVQAGKYVLKVEKKLGNDDKIYKCAVTVLPDQTITISENMLSDQL